MNKEETVQFLINNEYSEWKEEDKDWLLSLDEDKLKKMRSSVEDLESLLRKPESTGGSPEEFVARAPEGIKTILDRGLRMVNEQKDRMVQTLVQGLSEEQLRKKSIEELEQLSRILQEPSKAA